MSKTIRRTPSQKRYTEKVDAPKPRKVHANNLRREQASKDAFAWWAFNMKESL